jgi:hypothetical protein
MKSKRDISKTKFTVESQNEILGLLQVWSRKVDVRLPGKGNSTPHGARPVHLIISMIK